jgi:putative redox protein
MEVSVLHLGAVQFEITARGHKLVSDQPADAGGYDEGMTPPEFLLASLGSCAAYYAVDYLKRQKLEINGTRVRVHCEKVKPQVIPGQKPVGGVRLDNFIIEVEIPAELSDTHRKGVNEAVHRCLVHNTLLKPPKIDIAIHSTVRA